MTRLSPRLACNLVYARLIRDLYHDEKCDLARGVCAGGCRWFEFHEWLRAPLLPSEVDELARRRQRLEILLRGA